jgi:hypothetical protein
VPDDKVFAANPSQVQAGGGMTDKISELIAAASRVFESETSFDPQNPPWGSDPIGDGFAKNYVEPHAQLRDAVTGFARAVTGAARLTLESGKNFQTSQDDALDAIHNEGGGKKH